MGKIMPALLLVFLVEISLVFFGGTTYTNSILYSFLTNPVSWQAATFYIIMLAILTASAAAVIVPGSFYQINQWALFAGFSVVAITFIASITHLWAFTYGQLVGIFSNTNIAVLISSLITGPLLIFYIVAIVEWTRQN